MGVLVPVVGGKGGVGKTTTAVNVAAGLASLGWRTLLADLDPQDAGGSLTWLERRADGAPLAFDYDRVDLALSGELHRLPYDAVIVDTPAGLRGEPMRAAVQHATCAIAMTSNRKAEVHGFLHLYKTVLEPMGIPTRALIARVDPRRLAGGLSIRDQLQRAGISVFGPLVRAYVVHEDAYDTGQTIFELAGAFATHAQGDYRQVVSELIVHLDGTLSSEPAADEGVDR